MMYRFPLETCQGGTNKHRTTVSCISGEYGCEKQFELSHKQVRQVDPQTRPTRKDLISRHHLTLENMSRSLMLWAKNPRYVHHKNTSSYWYNTFPSNQANVPFLNKLFYFRDMPCEPLSFNEFHEL